MKKEVILAIIFGLLVGSAVTLGVYLNRHKNTSDQIDTATTNRIALDPINVGQNNDETLSLVKITSPTNESVQTEATIQISGTAIPDNFVVIFVNDIEEQILADSNGNFTLSASLETGSNVLDAYTVSEEGDTHHDQIIVIYTNKSLEENLVSDSEVKVEADKR